MVSFCPKWITSLDLRHRLIRNHIHSGQVNERMGWKIKWGNQSTQCYKYFVSKFRFCNLSKIVVRMFINTMTSSIGKKSALLAICWGNSPVTDEFPTQRPVTQSFDVFVDLRLNKRLSKQSWGWWLETQSCPLWRHSNELTGGKIHYAFDNCMGCPNATKEGGIKWSLQRINLWDINRQIFECKKVI